MEISRTGSGTDISSSKSGISPSRKIGPTKNFFKLPQVKLEKHGEAEDMCEAVDYISKEIQFRRANSIHRKKAELEGKAFVN